MAAFMCTGLSYLVCKTIKYDLCGFKQNCSGMCPWEAPLQVHS